MVFLKIKLCPGCNEDHFGADLLCPKCLQNKMNKEKELIEAIRLIYTNSEEASRIIKRLNCKDQIRKIVE